MTIAKSRPWRITRVTKRCRRCGVTFWVHHYRRNDAKYCSRRCARRDQRGPTAGGWRGGGVSDPRGYELVYAPDDPHRQKGHGVYAYEHRVVMAAALGRPLHRDEVVHHLDGNPGNNDPGNLAVMTQSEHVRVHAQRRKEGKSDAHLR